MDVNFCSFTPPSSTSISKFISDRPYLPILETQCKSMRDLQKIHAQLIKTGLAKDTVAASRVLAFCTAPGDVNYAYLVSLKFRTQTSSLGTLSSDASLIAQLPKLPSLSSLICWSPHLFNHTDSLTLQSSRPILNLI
ncbi:pentatricopeptide repeat (PPR-like) superfamily protein [Actinidia rufa]|uniref:Pentatricopeptide repeat (PPR-like) superfamily protein n=1 Tax=Actinidia rufa TaxID=165716 RepID=A0A7J0DYD3_9ERIC|nr:pentatricopeptide repeat (PPR-like) superfamily protein [Actinidia rufa]